MLVPLKEIYEEFGVNEEDVTELFNSGRINSYRIGNHKVVVLRRELNQSLA